MKIAIIGCGLIGLRRAKALGEHQLVIACDKDIERARNVCAAAGTGSITTDWKEAAGYSPVDIVIVSTTNDLLTPVGLYALEHSKHVLVEKPAARSYEEIRPFVQKAQNSPCKVKVGFNLRYHPGITKAKEIASLDEFGEIMFIRTRYGHGGRLGYEKEWRANPEISGGGELIDQGIHLIDLSRYFLGNFEFTEGFIHTYFWNMPVEDNSFVMLRTEKQQVACFHASCTEWKNLFCMEIYGKYGKLQIDGLGGSYGEEKLTYYRMLPQMGPPETKIWNFPGEDKSWMEEFKSFVSAINYGEIINGGIEDASEALKIVNKIYVGRRTT
jgi:predicted dehydrogenase